MKRLFFILIAFMSVFLASCSGYSTEANSVQESLHSNLESRFDDYEFLRNEFISPLVSSGIANIESWSDASQIPANRLVYFYFFKTNVLLESIDEVWDDPEWRKNNIGAEVVEETIRSYFDVEIEHIRESEFFDPRTNEYTLYGIGGGALDYRVMFSKHDNNMLTIDFIAFFIDENEPYFSGRVQIVFEDEDNYKYLWYEASKPTEINFDSGEVEQVINALAGSLMLGHSWDNISGENYRYNLSLITFYCILNPYHPTEIPAVEFEAFIQRYFDIPTSALREMYEYNPENETYVVPVDVSVDRANRQTEEYFRIEQIDYENGLVKVLYYTIWGNMAPYENMQNSVVFAGYVLLDKEDSYRVLRVVLTEDNSAQ